jgi:hypothetical protein
MFLLPEYRKWSLTFAVCEVPGMERILLSSVGVLSKDVRNLLVGGGIYMRRFSGKTQFGRALHLEFHLDIGLIDRIYEFSQRVRTQQPSRLGKPIFFKT